MVVIVRLLIGLDYDSRRVAIDLPVVCFGFRYRVPVRLWSLIRA